MSGLTIVAIGPSCIMHIFMGKVSHFTQDFTQAVHTRFTLAHGMGQVVQATGGSILIINLRF